MENQALREQCSAIIERISDRLYHDRKCIAAYLLGSFSHDAVWEWSDIQVEAVYDDDYRGKTSYQLYEDGMYALLNLHTLTRFRAYIGNVNVDDHLWKAFSKSRKLFSKDSMLDELFEEAFRIGGLDRQREMLLGFSGAVYYLNKAEKNLYIKENLENAVYFLPQLAENIAWIEIFKAGQIPEREVIPQGRRLNPEIISLIYDPLYEKGTNRDVVSVILERCIGYLEENTELVYQPVIQYLREHGSLEGFRYETRPHGFGINYEWLVRCGLAERYGIVEKASILDREICRPGYRIKS